MIEDFFEPLASGTFGTMPTGDKWSKQRKAVGHMFYKDRLKDMLEVYKHQMYIAIDKWNAEIAEKGSARIDAAVEFERIHSHFMNHICFGDDYNDCRFDFNLLDEKARTWSVQKCSMRQAVNNMFT